MTNAEHEEDAVAVLPRVPTIEQIVGLEKQMLEMEQLPILTNHHFAAGLYGREIIIPADTLVTGKAHAFEHLNVCIGDITVWTEDGMKRLTGVHVLRSRPGTKRVGYAHAETHWITVHANPENHTDTALLEAILVPPLALEESKE